MELRTAGLEVRFAPTWIWTLLCEHVQDPGRTDRPTSQCEARGRSIGQVQAQAFFTRLTVTYFIAARFRSNFIYL
jgi:hypothetical protein